MVNVHYDEKMLTLLKEFWKSGLLQETNRQFLHPLGLAMGVMVSDGGDATGIILLDYRDEVAGVVFGEIDADMLRKHKNVVAEQGRRARIRQEQLGWVQQPME